MATKKTAKSIKTAKPSKKIMTSTDTEMEDRESSGYDNRSSQRTSFKLKRSYVILGIVLVVIAALIYLLRGFFIVAMVNGQPITRWTYYNELEKQSGKQVLNTLVTKDLILQEAKKRNITVSQSEVDSEMKKIQDNLSKQGQTLDQVLALQGMTKDSLIDQIKFQKILTKMVSGNVKVSDKEIADYIDKNKESIPADANQADVKKQAADQLQQQKLNEEIQKFISNLQKNAKISYFVKQ